VKVENVASGCAVVAGGAGFLGSFVVDRLQQSQRCGEFFYDNLIMGTQMMEQARLFGMPEFVVITTVCAYPKSTTVPFTEDNLWHGYQGYCIDHRRTTTSNTIPTLPYIEYVRPGGIGAGAGNHKVLYNHVTITYLLCQAQYDYELPEYFDEEGQFHRCSWDISDAFVCRSAEHDLRNRQRALSYTSLIVHAWPIGGRYGT
jgi:hypothetical protein